MPNCMLEKANKKGAAISIKVYCPTGKKDTYKFITAPIATFSGIKPGDSVRVKDETSVVAFSEMLFERWDNES